MSEREREPGTPESGSSGYLFSEAGLESPLEELRMIFEKRIRTARNLGEEEKARQYEAAHEVARKKLAIALGEES